MTETTIVTMIIFTFVFIPLIIAEIARRQSIPTVEDFFLYSQKMPLGYAFFTIYSTWFSSFAVFGSSATFYESGPLYMTAFAWNILFAIFIFGISRRLWFYSRKGEYLTATDFFDDIYGSKALSLLITGIMLCFTVPYLEIQLFGGTFLINIATNGAIPWKVALLLFYVIMIVYLWAGGIRSVAMTDVFYGILVFFAMIVIGVILVSKVGGPAAMFNSLAEKDPQSVILGNAPSKYFLWLTMFLIIPAGAIMSPPMWLRSYSIKKEKSFFILPLLIAVATIGYIGSMLAGNAAKLLMPHAGDLNQVIPSLIVSHSHYILAAILFCGLSAASLSTTNSQLHAISAIYTLDIHKRYFDKNASDKKLITITKWVLLIVSAITYLVIITSPTMIMKTGLLGLSGTAQLLVPTLGAFFWKRSNAQGAIAGLTIGVFLLLLLSSVCHMDVSFAGSIGLAFNTVLFIVIGLCKEPNRSTQYKITAYAKDFSAQRKF